MSTNPRVDEGDAKLQSWDQAEPLFKDWLVRTAAAQYGHQLKADRSRVYSLLFGIPLVVLSTFVGTSVFASVNHSPSNGLKWLVGGVSVAAAALGSVQTFLGYAQLSERHRVAAIRYANLRREVQQAIAAQDFGPPRDGQDRPSRPPDRRQDVEALAGLGPDARALWRADVPRSGLDPDSVTGGSRPVGYGTIQGLAGAGRTGGSRKAGWVSRERASRGSTASASLRVSGGRFHFRSISFRIEV